MRGAEVRLVWQEHDDEVRRGLELAPVRLGRQLRHVLAHLACVVGEVRLAGVVVGCLEGIEICRKGRLRVDDDVLAARDPDDQVRAQGSVVGRRRRLGHVVAVLDHPGVLDDVAQLRLAPAATNVRRAQGVGQAAGALGERRHLRLEVAVRLLPDTLDPLQLMIHALEGVLQRADVPGQPCVCELEEAGAVRVERVGGQVLDRGGEPVVEGAALDRELGLGSRERALELDDLLCAPPALDERRAHEEEDAERAHEETDEKGCDDHRVDAR